MTNWKQSSKNSKVSREISETPQKNTAKSDFQIFSRLSLVWEKGIDNFGTQPHNNSKGCHTIAKLQKFCVLFLFGWGGFALEAHFGKGHKRWA